MKQVAVVIPNYNGKKYLNNCLRALYENTDMEIEVIVVDNHSSDGSVEQARALYPEVRYIMLDKNYGFSRAVNEGIRAANAPYVLLLNNDTEIKRDFVRKLWQRIMSNEKIFSAEAKMLKYADSNEIDSAGTFYNALGWAFARGKDRPDYEYEKVCDTFAACAGAAIYRKSVFEKIGMFDENYFAYLEDIDIGYRARIYGYRNVYEPKAKVLHVGSGTSGSRYNEFKIRFSARNNIYLIYRNMPLLQIIINFPLLLAGFVVKFVFFGCKGFGGIYISGIKEGFCLCRKCNKRQVLRKNLRNYAKIQIELWANVLRRRW